MKTKHGEVINLHWPEGNDDGELFVRGFLDDKTARAALLEQSEELENIACDLIENEFPESELSDQDTIDERCSFLVARARIERVYARWSQESTGGDLSAVLRIYTTPGRGRFAVTRATLFPRPPCCLSFQSFTGIYTCLKCGRRFRGPTDPYNLTGPADCERLVGDDFVAEFTAVHEGLERDSSRDAAA